MVHSSCCSCTVNCIIWETTVVACIVILLSSFLLRPSVWDTKHSIMHWSTRGWVGGEIGRSDLVEVTIGFVSYAIEKVVTYCWWPMAPCTWRASCKRFTMTALLPPVTRCQDDKCRHSTSAGKQASRAMECWLMSDGAADDEWVVFGILETASTGYEHNCTTMRRYVWGAIP